MISVFSNSTWENCVNRIFSKFGSHLLPYFLHNSESHDLGDESSLQAQKLTLLFQLILGLKV